MSLCVPVGDRTNVAGSDLSEIVPEEIEAEVKLAAEISMGTEVSEQDIGNIKHLCDQVCLFLSFTVPERVLKS